MADEERIARGLRDRVTGKMGKVSDELADSFMKAAFKAHGRLQIPVEISQENDPDIGPLTPGRQARPERSP